MPRVSRLCLQRDPVKRQGSMTVQGPAALDDLNLSAKHALPHARTHTGHAYAAAISACAAGQQWQSAVALFDDMVSVAGIRPDVVSCTALVRVVGGAPWAEEGEWEGKGAWQPQTPGSAGLGTALAHIRLWRAGEKWGEREKGEHG